MISPKQIGVKQIVPFQEAPIPTKVAPSKVDIPSPCGADTPVRCPWTLPLTSTLLCHSDAASQATGGICCQRRITHDPVLKGRDSHSPVAETRPGRAQLALSEAEGTGRATTAAKSTRLSAAEVRPQAKTLTRLQINQGPNLFTWVRRSGFVTSAT